jgi:2-methylcitrate dehydratase PrpD
VSHVAELGDFVASVIAEGVSPARAADTRLRILDTVGNGLAAAGEEPVRIVRRVAETHGVNPEAPIWGSEDRLPAASAALVNGTMAHALDFDDTHLPSVLHPSASVVPAVLASGAAAGADGRRLLAAVAAGNEVTIRLGTAAYDPALGNSLFFEKGLHATSICGTIGSAAACAILLGGGAAEAAHAMAIAASMGAGLIEANRTGGSIKRVHTGWAAHAGVTAAQLAVEGLTGPPTVFEGRFGFFRAYTDGTFDVESLVGDLGTTWQSDQLFYKPYPTNHFTHAGIDAAMALRDELDLDAVTAIRLGAPAPVLRTIAEPAPQKARPTDAYTARFSGPFTVAAALVGGGGLGVWLDDFTPETIADPLRLRLAGLVTCHADPRATELFPHQFPAVLEIDTADGTTHVHRVDHNRGGPENPLSDDELARKFTINAARTLPENRATAIRDSILALGSDVAATSVGAV